MAGQFVAFLASACMYLAAHIKAEPAKRTEALRHNLSTTLYISLNQVFVIVDDTIHTYLHPMGRRALHERPWEYYQIGRNNWTSGRHHAALMRPLRSLPVLPQWSIAMSL